MLTNPTDEIVALVTNLYNSTCNSTNTPAPNASVNPFGMGSTSMNTGTSASIFGGGNSNANTNTGSTNLFGSSSAQATNSNPFARNAAGFGAAPQNQSSNLFRGSTANSNSMNLFGAQSASNTGSSLFGGSSFSNTNNASTFGSANQATSLFGGSGGSSASGPFSQQNTNSSPFALPSATNQTNSLFGGQQQQLQFGGGATFGSQVKTGLFGQANASMGQTTNASNIFGQNVQTPFGAPTAQTNPFGSTPQNQTQSLFGSAGQQQQSMQGQDNPFAAAAQSATTNIFGAAQMQQQQASPFQNAATATFGGNSNMNMGQSLFGAANQTNQMNAAQAQNPAQTLQQQQQSIFGSNTFSAPPAQPPFGGSMFQQAREAQNPPPPMYGGQTLQNSSLFGGTAAATAPIQQSKTLYTPMELLSPDEIDAFNNNTFDISKIPTKPPPMELCI